MKIFRKIAAFFTAAAIAVAAAAATVVTAGAESISDTATAISSGKTVSTFIPKYNDTADYKVTVSGNGTIKLSFDAYMRTMYIYVYDSDGNIVDSTLTDEVSGSIFQTNYEICTKCYWNNTIEKCKGSVSYSVQRGTYYIRFRNQSSSLDNNGNGKLTLTATYPTSAKKATISYITINLKKGATLSLGAALSGGSGTVTWKSSKPSVASVSSTGKITAKKAGTTIITATCGSSSKKIKIKVS